MNKRHTVFGAAAIEEICHARGQLIGCLREAQLLWPHHDEHANDCAQCAPQLVGKTRLSLRCKGAPACNLGVSPKF
eukprot:1159049-Pelagomonas_calceolata.AAC.5